MQISTGASMMQANCYKDIMDYFSVKNIISPVHDISCHLKQGFVSSRLCHMAFDWTSNNRRAGC